MDIVLDSAAVFLSRGKRSPGMSPIGTRYGHSKAFYYVDPDIVTYDGEAKERMRVCEVISWHPHHNPHDSLLLAATPTPVTRRPLFLLEQVRYAVEPVWLEGRGGGARQYQATSCNVGPADLWLFRELGSGPDALITIIAQLEEIFSAHCEAGRVEQTEDERTHGQLSVAKLMLKG